MKSQGISRKRGQNHCRPASRIFTPNRQRGAGSPTGSGQPEENAPEVQMTLCHVVYGVFGNGVHT